MFQIGSSNMRGKNTHSSGRYITDFLYPHTSARSLWTFLVHQMRAGEIPKKEKNLQAQHAPHWMKKINEETSWGLLVRQRKLKIRGVGLFQ